MCFTSRCNANSYYIFVIATHVISIIDELLTNLQMCGDKCVHRGTCVGATSRGSMSLASSCNGDSYFTFVIATHIMPCQISVLHMN